MTLCVFTRHPRWRGRSCTGPAGLAGDWERSTWPRRTPFPLLLSEGDELHGFEGPFQAGSLHDWWHRCLCVRAIFLDVSSLLKILNLVLSEENLTSMSLNWLIPSTLRLPPILQRLIKGKVTKQPTAHHVKPRIHDFIKVLLRVWNCNKCTRTEGAGVECYLNREHNPRPERVKKWVSNMKQVQPLPLKVLNFERHRSQISACRRQGRCSHRSNGRE